jgi:hypothetical protein
MVLSRDIKNVAILWLDSFKILVNLVTQFVCLLVFYELEEQ